MDRRTIWAILLMMAIALVPAIFMKKAAGPARPAAGRDSGTARLPDNTAKGPSTGPVKSLDAPARDTAGQAPASASSAAAAEKTVRVTSPLFTYAVSTRGARLIQATLPRYRSMAPADNGRPANILPEDS